MVDDRIICILTVVVNSVFKIHVFTFDCVHEMVKATGRSGGSTFLKVSLVIWQFTDPTLENEKYPPQADVNGSRAKFGNSSHCHVNKKWWR